MVSRPECRRNGEHGTRLVATCQSMTGSVLCTEMLSVGNPSINQPARVLNLCVCPLTRLWVGAYLRARARL
jgi:hypothetical protein